MSMRCDTCQVSLNSSGQYQQHLGGKAHAKRLKLIASGGAPPPGKVKTINFVPATGGSEAPNSETKPAPSQPQKGEGSTSVYCETCSIHLNSPEQAQVHYKGAKHLRKLKAANSPEGIPVEPKVTKSQEQGYLYCGFCSISVNSAQQMTVHREGSKHKRNVEQRKRTARGAIQEAPAAKKMLVDPTDNIPHVDQSDILPFETMFPVSSASSPMTTANM